MKTGLVSVAQFMENQNEQAKSEGKIRTLCGAYKDFQSKGEGCFLDPGHEGDHKGDALDLLPETLMDYLNAR